MKKSILLLIAALALPAFGSGTAHWVYKSEADFKKGKFQNTVATNLGDVKLSRAVKTLLEQDPRVSAVYCLAQGPDGTVYAGTGPQGVLLQLKGDKVSTLASLDDENIFSLLSDRDGKLLVGTGGEHGRILKLDPARPEQKPVEVFAADAVQYIWKMVQTDDGNVYAATGPTGRIYQISPDGAKSILLDSKDNNVLSLISDGKDTLYAGTDPGGLIYRINRKTRQAFILFDAPEAEVSSLVLDANGNLFAGTGQASDIDQAGAADSGETERSGRPESKDASAPLPSPKPAQPKPPTPPPGLNDPNPIPPQPQNQMMFLGAEATDLDQADDGPAAALPTPQPGRSTQRLGSVMPKPGMRMPPMRSGEASEGNAIYRIDPGGFVTEIFRQPVMVLSLIEHNGVLLVGTGSEGLIYQVNPAAEETVILAKVDPKQVMSLLAAKDGRIIMGLANIGGLAALSNGFAAKGTYTSAVLDAGQISRFGKIHLLGTLPPATSLTIATRSGNVQEPSDAGWSKWSAEVPASEYVDVSTPPARCLQYRLTFARSDDNATPMVDEVDVAYRVANLAPVVKAIKTGDDALRGNSSLGSSMSMSSSSKPQSSMRMRTITWEASDPDNDALEYALYYRNGTRAPWILLQEKLKEQQYQWDTKNVPDGRYQIKVVASDGKANPRGEGKEGSRVSETIVVDNTPPVIGDLRITRIPKGVRIEALIADRTGTVANCEYSVDSKDDWQAVAASDKIFDSPEEGVSFVVDGLAPGTHQIMLRATDDHGNQAYEAIQATVESPEK